MDKALIIPGLLSSAADYESLLRDTRGNVIVMNMRGPESAKSAGDSSGGFGYFEHAEDIVAVLNEHDVHTILAHSRSACFAILALGSENYRGAINSLICMDGYFLPVSYGSEWAERVTQSRPDMQALAHLIARDLKNTEHVVRAFYESLARLDITNYVTETSIHERTGSDVVKQRARSYTEHVVKGADHESIVERVVRLVISDVP